MKSLRTRLQEARKPLGLPWRVLERDYLLSWVLAGIGRADSLRNTLIYKGGTALKKCYFGDYRFSEDLDFSGLDRVPTGQAMERAVRSLRHGVEAARRVRPRWKSPANATPRRTLTPEARRPSRSGRASLGRGNRRRAS